MVAEVMPSRAKLVPPVIVTAPPAETVPVSAPEFRLNAPAVDTVAM